MIFFFQAEDGIRDKLVTGVQTCALPIYIVQDAYVRAYEHLNQFEGRARFSTWLTKIAIYEAYARVRRTDYKKVDSISLLEGEGLDVKSKGRDPEQQTYDGELKMVLEKAFGALPDD